MQIQDILTQIESRAIIDKVPIVDKKSAEVLLSFVAPHMHMLEVGTATGYSGIAMLSKYDTTTLTTLDISTDRLAQAVDNFKQARLTNRVTVLQADALMFLETCSQKFDLIFLDGAQGKYAQMLGLAKKVLKKGGILIADNVLRFNRTNEAHAKRLLKKMGEFITLIQSDSDFTTTLYDCGDGLCIAIKK